MEQNFSFLRNLGGDTVFCLGRAFVLGILVSGEALLARRKRVRFERHLILFATFSVLMAAEIFGLCLGLLGEAPAFGRLPAAAWVWYPILSTAGLLGIAFSFDYERIAEAGGADDAFSPRANEAPPLEKPVSSGPARARKSGLLRRHSRRFFIAIGILLALGALLMQRLPPFPPLPVSVPPTSLDDIGAASFLLHGLQAAAMIALGWKALRTGGIQLTLSESRVFAAGAACGVAGAVAQLFVGPREPFTTLAFALFVGVLLRDEYRRSELEAIRAWEDRTARMLLFHRITTRLKSTAELPRLYEIAMDSLLANLRAESGAIYVRANRASKAAAPDGEQGLRPARIDGPYPPPMPVPGAENAGPEELRALLERTPVSPGAGLIGGVAATGVPVYLADPRETAARYVWPTGATRPRTTIALPLRDPEGVFGVIQVVNRRDGAPFSEEDLRFMSLIAEQAGLSIYNARLQGEALQRQRAEEQLSVARNIQLLLIPSELPRIAGISLGAEYLAAEEVGGDYFGFCRIDHDHLGLIIFDVAGRGVPGALLMAITSTFFKMAAPRSNSPAWVLNEVNAALNAEMRHGLYVTALYGVLKLSTLQFTFVCAGHTDAIVVRDSPPGTPSARPGTQDAAGAAACERHKPRGAALGLLRPNRFRAVMEQETIQLREGDTLLLYTDGVVEATNEAGEQFGEERLCQVARASAREGPRKLASDIEEAVRRHAGGPPEDDLTVVALKIAPDPEQAAEGASPAPGAETPASEGGR